MTDEVTQRRQIARADQAQQILDNPLIKEAFEAIEREIVEKWQDSKEADEEIRARAYLMSRLFKRLRGQFEAYVRLGERAKGDLLRQEGEKKQRRSPYV